MERKAISVAAMLFVLMIIGLGFSPAYAVNYDITDLGTLDGYGVGPSKAYGINNAGQVVGWSSGYMNFKGVLSPTERGFLYSGGTMLDLGCIGNLQNYYYNTYSTASGINNLGQITGTSYAGSSFYNHAFIRGSDGVMNDIGTLPGAYESFGYAINNNGDVAGYATAYDPYISYPGEYPWHAFLYSGGKMIDLGTLWNDQPMGGTVRDQSGKGESFAYGINDQGQVVGTSRRWNTFTNATEQHAFLYSNGKMSELVTLGGPSVATSINNSGQVVGYSYLPGGTTPHAFLYSNGQATDLGTFPGSIASAAYSTNNNGQVVGDYTTPDSQQHAFIYNGKQILALENLLSATGWQLTEAYSINDFGQIVGYGTNPAGYERAFLLTPGQLIIAATAGTGGTITPSGNVQVSYGSNQTFAISPSTGYTISSVLVDGISVGAVTTYTFSNVTADHTISASFIASTYTIAASAGPNGAITPSGNVAVNSGGSQTFTISPSTGYHISDVQVDNQSVGAVTTYTFSNVMANHTINASFAINTYTITASATTGGTITPSGAITVNYGSSLTFTITPDAYYHISDVQVDGVSAGAVTSYSFANIVADHSIAAVFQQDPPAQVTQIIKNIISSLPLSSFSNPNNQNALLNKMNAVITMINSGQYQNAMVKLTSDILPKTDGCNNAGAPDSNDWITTCSGQAQLYPAVLYLINQLKSM